MSFLNSMIGQVCYPLCSANLASANMLLNNVDRRDTRTLVVSKLLTAGAFCITLGVTNEYIGLKNKLSVFTIIAPLAVTFGTFAIAQVAKKLGKHQKALATFDKYCDRAIEIAFSVASIAGVIIFASQISRTVSQVNLFMTGLSLVLLSASIALRINYLMLSYLKPKNFQVSL